MKNTIIANGMKLQELHYQNTRNELLAKEQKTSMELSSVIAANSALELDLTNRITTLTSIINNLSEQINKLQERINQQSNETNEMKVASIRQLSALQVEIAKLELEKQNMELCINQIRSNK
jgi:chaperonin cofactor prefoldin